MQVKQVLAHKYVKRLFVARFVSNYGNGLGPIALAFGILALPNGSANLLGLVLGTSTVVFLMMAPFGGVIADKYGRARMVGLTDMIAGVILFVQVGFFATGNVPIAVLLIVNGGFGILWEFSGQHSLELFHLFFQNLHCKKEMLLIHLFLMAD